MNTKTPELCAFTEWVADAIEAISGIRPQQIQRADGECALTSAGRRMVACQGLFEVYFDPVDLGNMRVSARALTHFTLRGLKPHGHC